jgi:hypothetical protein
VIGGIAFALKGGDYDESATSIVATTVATPSTGVDDTEVDDPDDTDDTVFDDPDDTVFEDPDDTAFDVDDTVFDVDDTLFDLDSIPSSGSTPTPAALDEARTALEPYGASEAEIQCAASQVGGDTDALTSEDAAAIARCLSTTTIGRMIADGAQREGVQLDATCVAEDLDDLSVDERVALLVSVVTGVADEGAAELASIAADCSESGFGS